ncbi:BrnT family toxin [uncultured Thiodictyon sp.]|uniref:BrnT family toxin n=1 Tax=uncultured Thiodictyon sp. TaxID=1846217 RepID=UPI0025EF1168|nr:BrnT family toxin [uncultured Thiodictyon sp.]
MKFDWGEEKATRNLAKHGVSFDEAVSVFDDPLYIDFFDPEHSDREHRYIRVGCSERRRILVVSYTERGSAIRLISARPATNKERQAYEEK